LSEEQGEPCFLIIMLKQGLAKRTLLKIRIFEPGNNNNNTAGAFNDSEEQVNRELRAIGLSHLLPAGRRR
jgi:hypothetical protein